MSGELLTKGYREDLLRRVERGDGFAPSVVAVLLDQLKAAEAGLHRAWEEGWDECEREHGVIVGAKRSDGPKGARLQW